MLPRICKSRGIDKTTGVFGDHKVQLAGKSAIRLDQIKTPSLPYRGFFKTTQVAKGKAGIHNASLNVLKELKAKGKDLDIGTLLGQFKALQVQFGRLQKLGAVTPNQVNDTMWMFTKEVEELSNQDLASIYQTFTSAEMDLLQTSLMREGQINPDAKDAKFTSNRLFDLQALILKEVSNRATQGQLEDEEQRQKDIYSKLEQENLFNATLDENQWSQIINEDDSKNTNLAPKPKVPHDISSGNLLTLVEVAAQSATTREKTSQQETDRLLARNIKSVSIKNMGDILRQSELTVNLSPENLLNHVITNPMSPSAMFFIWPKKISKFQAKALGIGLNVMLWKNRFSLKLQDMRLGQMNGLFTVHLI